MNYKNINKLHELKRLRIHEFEIEELLKTLELTMNKKVYKKCEKHLEIVYKEIKKKINKIEKKFNNKKIEITIDDILLIL